MAPAARRLRLAGLALGATLLLAGLPNLASACGCGAVIAPEDSPPSAASEWSIVAFDGGEERILMRLDLGRPLDEAALVLPVRPGAKVALGSPDAFDRVTELTAPRTETHRRFHLAFGPPQDEPDSATAGAPASGGAQRVEVLDSQQLGPLDVVTLRSRSADAMQTWLADNDFPLPGGLAGATQSYLDEGWDIVVARLSAAASGTTLQALQPLEIRFPAKRPVYPLRMSRLADGGTRARVDLFAPWQASVGGYGPVTKEEPGQPQPAQGVGLVFAGEADAGGDGALADLVGSADHLTSYRFAIQPDSPDRDPAFARDRDPEAYQQVITRTEDVYLGDVIAGVGGAVVGGIVLVRLVW